MNETGLYVHWPYCAHVCPYCDFNVYRARGNDYTPLLDAIVRDIEAHRGRLGRRELVSVFLGGGTPSLLSGAQVARLIDAANRAFGLALECEITLEANPEDAPRFAEHAAAGVNRFSIGAQAFDDAALKALGRWHDAAAGRGAIEAAAATGQRVSLDLIYAREAQSIDAWRAELREALTLPVEHVSLYQLTIEPKTAFARRFARGKLTLQDVEAVADFYEVTQEACEAAGFPAYEISNHARAPAARARHNMLYWRSQDWIGVGPGAHGRITHAGARLATEAQRRPGDYVDAVREHGIGWANEARLSGEEIADEMLIMGLRIKEGLDLDCLAWLRGRAIKPETLGWLESLGLLHQRERRIRLTARGRMLANKIATELAV